MSVLKVTDNEIRAVYATMQQRDETVTADVILCNPVYRAEFLKRLDVDIPVVEEATLRRLINLRKSSKLEPRSKP